MQFKNKHNVLLTSNICTYVWKFIVKYCNIFKKATYLQSLQQLFFYKKSLVVGCLINPTIGYEPIEQ